jgi:hypothetical protein
MWKTENVDHLHEHFTDPVRIRHAHYILPETQATALKYFPIHCAITATLTEVSGEMHESCNFFYA